MRRICPCPPYATPGSAGLDLLAAIDAEHRTDARRSAWRCPPASPSNCRDGVEAQVRPRSGLALNHGITC